MITYSGRHVWPNSAGTPEGEPTDIGPSLEDIAVGLGRQSRFAGQSDAFYTVLCHSLVCGQIAREFYPDLPELRRYLLLHDGHESVLSDVPTTWKTGVTRADEQDIDERIHAEYGFLVHGVALDIGKQIDAAALAGEAHALGHAEAEAWWSRSNWDDLVRRAYDLTTLSVMAGNPRRYLAAEAAISAFTRALQT